MSQWLGTQSLQRNYHERTQCAHYVFALSKLVHSRLISLRKRTSLFLKDLGRSLIHDVNDTVDLVQCLPRNRLHGEPPEAGRTNTNKPWKKFSRQRHFKYRWPEVFVNLTHRAKKKTPVGCLQEIRDSDAIRIGVTFFQRVQRVPQSALPHQFESRAIKPFIHIDFTVTLLYLRCDRVSELCHARNQ